jgi:hypothetical protein
LIFAFAEGVSRLFPCYTCLVKTPPKSPNPFLGGTCSAEAYERAARAIAEESREYRFGLRQKGSVRSGIGRFAQLSTGYLRTRSTLWWLMFFFLLFALQFARLTIFSTFANQEWNRIENAQPPTRAQMRRMLDLK